MVTDGHNSLLGAQWKQLCRDRGIKQLTTEPYSHWQNLAEAGIRELKRLYRKISHNVYQSLLDTGFISFVIAVIFATVLP